MRGWRSLQSACSQLRTDQTDGLLPASVEVKDGGAILGVAVRIGVAQAPVNLDRNGSVEESHRKNETVVLANLNQEPLKTGQWAFFLVVLVGRRVRTATVLPTNRIGPPIEELQFRHYR